MAAAAPESEPVSERPSAPRPFDLARPKALLSAHGRALGVVALVGVIKACSAGGPPPKTLDGLTSALGKAAHVVVRPHDFVWEASDGLFADYGDGRRILFLGSEKAGTPRDLYRARVRLSPEGRPLEIRDVVNLTSTPYGDEQGLVRDATGERVAFATYAYGQLQGLTALDLRGEGRAAKTNGVVDRAMLYISNIQETGDGRGILRVQVALEKEATSAVLRFEGGVLVAQLAMAQGGVRTARVDIDKAELVTPVDGVKAELLIRIPKRPIHWLVDTVRAIPWIGPEPIAWLEAKVWEWKDKLKRVKHGIGSTAPKDVLKADAEKIAARPLDPTAAGEDGGYWPPSPVPTIYQTPEEGEGQWVAVQQEWMRRIPGAPSPFYRTFVRPDVQRPYSKIILLAMDTRQLDFDMEAGVEDPKPTVGSFHGTGRIPREPAIARRVVAAWNGGFKTEHGHYGMMLKKRVLLPPVPTGATAMVMDDGRFGMGSWAPTKDIATDIFSYRQNMDPLVEDGVFNPRKRVSWGAVLVGQPKLTGQQTERSGLCITKAKHTLYVWGDDVGPEALGKAMQLAGCDYGMHLDMNPYHTGYVFMTFEDAQLKTGHSETLTPLMAIGPRRYIDYNPKDFFFALLRDPTPPVLTTASGPVALVADEGVQPPPKWLPGIFKGQLTGKSEPISISVFDPGRVRWVVRAGTSEKLTAPHELAGDDAKRAIAAIGFGSPEAKHHLGLAIDGKVVTPMVAGEATLAVKPDGQLAVFLASETPVGTDLVQGTLLVNDGKPVDHASLGGLWLRLAVGVTKEGRVVVARAKLGGDDALAQALIDAGCVRAILARGQADGFVARAGTPEAPMSNYPQTTLYALAVGMAPRAFRTDKDANGKALYPAVTKAVP